MEKKPYYLTTAIAYTSGKPHIGNTYEAILADSIVRYKRQQGYDVRFQTGTDEHGQKVELKAAEKGVTPKEFVDEVSGEIRRIWDLVGTSYDKFIRTTDEDHEKQVQKIFKKLYDQGDIYKGEYEGMYCTPCESFFTTSQLVDGKCPDCGRECTPAKEEAYFFRMSKYADRLIEHINTHPEFIQPESRKNEVMNNFLLPGLQDLCVSRTSFKWGVPVDFDPKHVIYVWIDALSNYITGLGYDVDGNHGELYKKYWPADLHLIGKDILRFHTIYWPIMLMALDVPFKPVHLLFINLLTDSLPALAIGMEPSDNLLLKKKPRNPKKGIFTRNISIKLIVYGILIGTVTLSAFYIGDKINPLTASTMAFATLTLARLFHGFNCRSESSIFKIGIKSNLWSVAAFVIGTLMLGFVIFVKFMHSMFMIAPLTGIQIIEIIALAFVPTVIIQVVKVVVEKIK